MPSAEIVHLYYSDIGLTGPRGGCGFFSVQRVVAEKVPCPFGEQGQIRYRGRNIAVWRRQGGSLWESRCVPLQVTWLSPKGGV